MKVIIDNYTYRNRNFTICNHEGHYVAIEDKYIDEDGKLNQVLHGGQMFANSELDGCLRLLKQSLDMDYYESKGYSRAEAMVKVMGLPVEMIKKLEAILN